MKIEIKGGTVKLAQVDTGQATTCLCEYSYAIVLENYKYDSCVVFFEDTSAIYYGTNYSINENHSCDQQFVIVNPISEILHINMNNLSNNCDYTMELFGIDGRYIRTENLNSSRNRIYIDNLENGIYLVVIKENGIIFKTKKLIKM